MLLVGLRRSWHPNGALASSLDLGLRDEPQSFGRPALLTTWDETGRKRSEGNLAGPFMLPERRVGAWHFWNRKGDETTFDFGCRRHICD